MFSASQSDREVLIFEQPFAYKSRGRQMRRLLASHGTVALTPPDALAQPLRQSADPILRAVRDPNLFHGLVRLTNAISTVDSGEVGVEMKQGAHGHPLGKCQSFRQVAEPSELSREQ